MKYISEMYKTETEVLFFHRNFHVTIGCLFSFPLATFVYCIA
jgi:hypothetical protein